MNLKNHAIPDTKKPRNRGAPSNQFNAMKNKMLTLLILKPGSQGYKKRKLFRKILSIQLIISTVECVIVVK